MTLSALVARNSTLAYPFYFYKGLDSGLTPSEVSELLTHLAFYAGWPNAFGAIGIVREIFAKRGIDANELPAVTSELLSIEMALPDDAVRKAFIADNVSPISPALQHFTDDLLYYEVWLRPSLAPRDRGLATVAVLAALGQSTFFPVYLGRATSHGVTREEVGEALAHIAFYTGWGNAVQAAMVAKAFYSA